MELGYAPPFLSMMSSPDTTVGNPIGSPECTGIGCFPECDSFEPPKIGRLEMGRDLGCNARSADEEGAIPIPLRHYGCIAHAEERGSEEAEDTVRLRGSHHVSVVQQIR